MATRPTSDRLRETLFNVLQPRIHDARVLDLFAGSGAVGIEALSRGAARSCFVERAPAALAAIRGNLAALQLTARAEVEPRSVAHTLTALPGRAAPFHLVFLDPPYEAADDYAATLRALGSSAAALLAPDALVIAEHARRAPLAARYGTLTRTRVLEQGDAALSFYTATASAAEPAP